ncbi:DUF3413 domain-containing protein [Vibrio cholerae]|nr:DUF3413 domain-containing protein [Vibrio cholerae]EGR0756650.1 DUF3413 domain-containing protein [Vibrio cholerae]EGR0819911.1 DUF3413 domain-containing protein [Vibrio cholerae]EGR0891167.1 DUF3413 domain-containing protein [Vibrio cholerae]EGR1464032.1 DUF3413 domain-containing protein [Vibrio cholerae]
MLSNQSHLLRGFHMLLMIKKNIEWLFSHFILNAVLLAILGLPYLQWMEVSSGNRIAYAYLSATQFGWFGLFAFAITLVSLALVWLPSRLLHGVVFVASWAVSILLMVDIEVYQQYRFHLSGFVWDLLLHGGQQVISVSWYTLAMAGFIVFVVGFAQWLIMKLAQRIQHSRGVRWVSAVWLLSLLSSQFIHAWKDATYDNEIPSYSYHWPLYYPLTAKRFFDQLGVVDAQSARRQQVDFHAPTSSTLNYPLRPLHIEPPAERPNILLIGIDAWRFDDANRDVTPNIAHFGQQATRFTHHLSGGNSTQAGLFSLFYGLPATYWEEFQTSQTRPLLMQTLADLNYQFAIYGSAPLNSPPFDRTIFSKIAQLRTVTPGENSPQRDERITEDFLHFLEQRDRSKPYFGFLFYDSAHAADFPTSMTPPFTPYWERVDHIKLNNDFDPEPYHNRYRNALYYADSLIGKVLEQLQARDELRNTIVIITSDHGEEFNDNRQNYWGHGSNYSMAQIHVPLYIYIPDKEGSVLTHKTTHLDIAPMLMQEVLGVQNPLNEFALGYPLWQESPQREWTIIGSYFNYALVSDKEMLVSYPTGRVETLNSELAPEKERQISTQQIMQALEEMRQFLR